jgi:hypothetical protein
MKRTLLLVLLVACKSRGEADLKIEFPQDATCTPFDGTEVSAYILSNAASCDTCQCGACFDACHAENCVSVCDDGCPVADLERGISIQPQGGGLYTVIFDFSIIDAQGIRHLVASACAEVVVEDDGTATKSAVAAGVCCGP